MKSFWSLMTAFFLMFAMVGEADAKRFGSGGFGKSYKSTPFGQKKASPQQNEKKNAQQQGQKKGGMMGGLMGGLLAGGLFAALLGSGAFEDLKMMDIILMAIIAFVIFRVIRSMRNGPQPAAAGAYQQQFRQQAPDTAENTGSTHSFEGTSADQGQVPFDLPENFDQTSFLNGALEHYRTVQKAWNDGDLSVIEEYVSPELFDALSRQRNKLMVPPQTEILDLSADIARAEQEGTVQHISILFRGVCKDELEKSQDGIFDIWHLARDTSSQDAPWIIVGIEAE